MFRKAGAVVCMLGVISLVGVSLAGAEETSPNRLGGKFGVFGNVGYSSYAMNDVNSGIDATKLGYSIVGYSTDATDINSGLDFNVGVQYAFLDYLAVGVEGGMLLPNEGKVTAKGSLTGWDNVDSALDYNLPATEFGVFAKGLLPVGSRLLFNAQLGLDMVMMNGTVKYTDNVTGSSTQGTMTGSTVGVKAQVGGEVFLAQFLSLGLDLGYRLADITSVTSKDSNGNTLSSSDTSSASVDYSGAYFQGGIRLYF